MLHIPKVILYEMEKHARKREVQLSNQTHLTFKLGLVLMGHILDGNQVILRDKNGKDRELLIDELL